MQHFSTVLTDVLHYLADGANLFGTIFSCFPDVIQQIVFSAFVVYFGFATLKFIISCFS